MRETVSLGRFEGKLKKTRASKKAAKALLFCYMSKLQMEKIKSPTAKVLFKVGAGRCRLGKVKRSGADLLYLYLFCASTVSRYLAGDLDHN